MKTFNASDMAHKRSEIFEAASTIGAIIQRKNTNGEVLEEFVLIKGDSWNELNGFTGSINNELKEALK
tara:strand:+ start:1265 stop:1468 length:204 start_codon:yes stop_codon:yes gene_type:complete